MIELRDRSGASRLNPSENSGAEALARWAWIGARAIPAIVVVLASFKPPGTATADYLDPKQRAASTSTPSASRDAGAAEGEGMLNRGVVASASGIRSPGAIPSKEIEISPRD